MSRQFDEVVGPILEKRGAPWLLKEPNGDVLVVEPGKSTHQKATAAELRDGVFFKDFAEFQAAQHPH